MAVKGDNKKNENSNLSDHDDAFLKNTNPEGEHDQLDGDLIKNATKVKVTGDRSNLDQPMPEAQHASQGVNLDEEFDINNGQQYEEEFTQPGNQYSPPPESSNEPFNEEFADLSSAEQDEYANMTADAVINGYCEAKMAIPLLISISERKLNKLHKKGEININQRIPAERGSSRTISVKEFVLGFNEKIIDPFKTSDDFKDNVKPLLASILKRKGIALSPEKLLVYYVGMDLVKTSKHAIEAYGDRKEMLELLRDLNSPSQPQPQAPVSPMQPDFQPQQAQPQQPAAPPTTDMPPQQTTPDIVNEGKPGRRNTTRVASGKKNAKKK